MPITLFGPTKTNNLIVFCTIEYGCFFLRNLTVESQKFYFEFYLFLVREFYHSQILGVHRLQLCGF